ncbi:MAG: DUF192 domain-containing protein [Treponema sp.]|jgi:uncharacterized membrane protein (UPF0127 family)|nr:DUF192 domain-containing protein [Treponema sp.]
MRFKSPLKAGSGKAGPLRRRAVLLWALLFSLGGLNCAPAGQKTLALRELVIETASGAAVPLSAEIAVTAEEQAAGLMNRRSLPDGKGMLFVYARDERMSFWMKNTLIPLSIAFIAYDGRILEIRDMKPRDLTPVRSARSVRYALEVPQGWFDRAGIAVGDRLILAGD